MNNRFWILVGVVALIIVIGFGAYLLFSGDSSNTPVQTPGSENPFGTPSGTVTQGTTDSGPLLIIETINGEQVSVPDFTPGKQSFPIGSDTYYFITNNQQTQGENAAFDIVYGTDSSISIGLFKEPLGAARTEAERSLRQLLKLPDASICKLSISVAVPYSINQFYSGQNLGLSFCPGATALPN